MTLWQVIFMIFIYKYAFCYTVKNELMLRGYNSIIIVFILFYFECFSLLIISGTFIPLLINPNETETIEKLCY